MKPAFPLGTRLKVVGSDSGRYYGLEGPLVVVNDKFGKKPTWPYPESWCYGVDLTHAGVDGLTGVRFFGRSEVEVAPCRPRQSMSARTQVPAAKRVTTAKRPAKKR